ncbi:FAD-dependent oxidoreductase [bacterium]|nr:MAG: FAD-dependent oxidoreductase [bacterium]
MDRYDLIVIGAGMGGVSAAFSATERGMHVALVERAKIGGT